MPENATEVTAAGIARLAGVGRAAVSNWRRRHADFPLPVGGTDTSPSFALADVERWLRAQGKLAEVPARERVWQELAGDPAGAAAALVRVGCVLVLVRERPEEWQKAAARGDADLARALPSALERVLVPRLAPGSGTAWPAVPIPPARELRPVASLLRGAAELAGELGATEAFEFLLGRYLDANPRQYTLTPADTASLMAALAVPPGGGAGAKGPSDRTASRGSKGPTARTASHDPNGPTVYDPASGTGSLLCAVERPSALHAQESAPELAALTALRLLLRTDPGTTRVEVAAGDTLRADAFPRLAADAVLCHPPFNERNWGHDELAYDPRWEYGFPARTESELAWVQHALARLRPGGIAVLLMPPAAASRRSGRRVRADLLRRGALRAVVALPAGAAPPYGVPLHLWVLRRPGGPGKAGPSPELLLVDTARPGDHPGGRDDLDWASVRATALGSWRAFERDGTLAGRPGVSRSMPVIDLLDDDVDLAPARHLPPLAAPGGAAELDGLRDRLAETLRRTVELTPGPARGAAGAQGAPAPRTTTTVGELARTGALELRAGGAATGPGGPLRVLTEQDVLAGGAPSGALPEGPGEEPVLVRAGDVVVPVLGGGSVARVVDAAAEGAALGRNLQLLRPDPGALDPWFLAGFLRGTANNRRASSYASTATRLDVRRLQLPRLPLKDQRHYGEHFRALAAFEDELRRAARQGDQLVRALHDGLADGSLTV
ncbi:N-6 DNA methylase [Streptomyces sp. 8L]|uniref:N-6 DNA methylase n=1 Tax=Streptomyces sp. 8L TaxID=2877242 RepID=UPI001CD3C8A5|nr:N-6 DNA methylase [Streptomyces sp. 8L]MCA1218046.1 N-6 DNA methylase [Streptomyces sp. 8L]